MPSSMPPALPGTASPPRPAASPHCAAIPGWRSYWQSQSKLRQAGIRMRLRRRPNQRLVALENVFKGMQALEKAKEPASKGAGNADVTKAPPIATDLAKKLMDAQVDLLG